MAIDIANNYPSLQDHIQKIIEENTSPNFNSHAKKQKGRIEERIRRNNQLLSTLTEEDLESARQEVGRCTNDFSPLPYPKMDTLVMKLEAKRDLSHVKVHLDLDAFYAAVEMRDAPHLRSIPMAVGSDAMLVGGGGDSYFEGENIIIRAPPITWLGEVE